MEEAEKYRSQFVNSLNEIEMNLSFILEDWEGYLGESAALDDLYRMVHSLKSGAAFLDLYGIEECAHAVEDRIEAFRRDQGASLELKAELSRLLDQLDLPPTPWERGKVGFTADEKELIAEAELRGEAVYRLTCFLDPGEPMKKARAFLIQNNLEISFNVIKTDPSLRGDDDFSVFTVFLSTREKRDALRRAVNVDRIDEVRIDTFSLEEGDRPEEPEILMSSQGNKRHPVSVEMDRLSELAVYLGELRKLTLRRKGRAVDLLGGMERVLENLLYEPLFILAEGMKAYLVKLCERAGKKVSLTTGGDNIMISLSHRQMLSEIFQQFIRNSLTHGIQKEGVIILAGRKEGRGSLITYTDDGLGLDEKALREKSGDSTSSLIDLISRPGFSTSPRADVFSGRGMGLNIVKNNVELMGGRLDCLTPPGGGLTFTIFLPREKTVSLLQYRVGRHIASVPLSFVEKELPLDHRLLKRNRKNEYFYRHGDDHIRLFEKDRPVEGLEAMKRARFVIILNYLTRRYALLADELLLERSIPADKLEGILYIDPLDLEKFR